jgi:hypothetical protein
MAARPTFLPQHRAPTGEKQTVRNQGTANDVPMAAKLRRAAVRSIDGADDASLPGLESRIWISKSRSGHSLSGHRGFSKKYGLPRHDDFADVQVGHQSPEATRSLIEFPNR